MKDSEQGSSEDSDSEATAIPKRLGVGDEIDGVPIIAELDPGRMLDSEHKWIAVGKNVETGKISIMLPKGDKWDGDELTGFVYRAFNPQFMLSNLNQGVNNG